MTNQVMIVTTLPAHAVEAVLDAISQAGGGVLGEYTHCAFTNEGLGHFKPGAGARPHVGDIGNINHEPEVRIETFSERTIARAVVKAIRQAHPYEEPVIYIIPVLSEADL